MSQTLDAGELPIAMTTGSKSRSVPLVVKIGFTAFMAVLVPYYWKEYGPTNFLYFCDIALFCGLISVWTGKSLPASMAVVGITIPQLVWQVDFLASCLGQPVLGMTDYMFNSDISLFARGLSFFHFWLPILLLCIVHRLGYDRRALIGWTLTAWAAILVAYFLLPAPGDVLDFANQPRNVNYVFGMSGETPQTMMPSWAWLGMMMVGLPLIVFVPTHWLCSRVFKAAGPAEAIDGRAG